MSDISSFNLDGTIREIKDGKAYRITDERDTDISNTDLFPYFDSSSLNKKNISWDDLKREINNAVIQPSWRISNDEAEYVQNGSSPIVHDKSDSYLVGNVLINDIYSSSYGYVNGSCYVGGNKVVSYFSKNGTSNTGNIRCYNLKTYSIEWTYPIVGYHGNSVTYNPNNNHIYICGAIDETDNSRINKIVDVDLANPSVVVREISLPGITQCYSLTFDSSTNKFYAIAYIGTTSGVSDMLYVYDEGLTTLLDSKILEDYPAVKHKLSGQGVQVAINGRVYLPTYDSSGTAIYGYDVETGEITNISNIPKFINKCRYVAEVQSLIYDFDNDIFMAGSQFWCTGALGYFCNMLFELNMFRDVIELEPVPTNDYWGMAITGEKTSFTCVVAGNSLKPSWQIAKDLITVPNDCFIYARINNRPVDFVATHSSNGVNAQTFTLMRPSLDNYSGMLQGVSASDKLGIVNLSIPYHSEAQFKWCSLGGFNPTGNLYANIFTGSNSKLFFKECTFEDYSGGTSANRYHILADDFTQIHCNSCTFSGAVNTNALLRYGSSISIS